MVETMAAVQAEAWGNASSVHPQGLAAAEVLERSRSAIAAAFNAPIDDVLFTSGATESVHLALLGLLAAETPGRIVISSVEHPAVLAAAQQLQRHGWEIALWPVDANGRIRLEEIDRLLSPPTRMVSLIWGQSEVGTLQPIQTVGRVCSERGIAFHTDATQVVSQGRVDWNQLPVDLLSASAHKFGGPKGVGLLFARQTHRRRLQPLQGGGGQEQGVRAGTQPVALIAGMAQALEQTPQWSLGIDDEALELPTGIKPLRDQLLNQLLEDPRLTLTGDRYRRLPHHISLVAQSHQHQPLSGRALVRDLATRGLSVSSGSACASGKEEGSAVLAAMNLPTPLLRSGLRLSLGPWIQDHQIPVIAATVRESLDHVEAEAERRG